MGARLVASKLIRVRIGDLEVDGHNDARSIKQIACRGLIPPTFRRSPSFDVTDKSSFQEREAAELALHLLSCGAAALRPDEYAESWFVGRAAVVEQGGEAGCLDVMGQSLCSAAFGEGCKLNVPGVGDLRRAAPNSWAAPSSGPFAALS